MREVALARRLAQHQSPIGVRFENLGVVSAGWKPKLGAGGGLVEKASMSQMGPKQINPP